MREVELDRLESGDSFIRSCCLGRGLGELRSTSQIRRLDIRKLEFAADSRYVLLVIVSELRNNCEPFELTQKLNRCSYF